MTDIGRVGVAPGTGESDLRPGPRDGRRSRSLALLTSIGAFGGPQAAAGLPPVAGDPGQEGP